MGICCMGVLPQGRSVIARFVLGEDGMTERACPFPARAKRQRERETGRATKGRPYDAIVCGISEELAGGIYAAPTNPCLLY